MNIFLPRAHILAGLCLSLLVAAAVWPQDSFALQLAQRSLDIGTSEAGASTDHTFGFTYPSENVVGSIVFEYCTSPLPQVTCDAPAGIEVSDASLVSETGETGFLVQGVVGSAANRLVIARTPQLTALTQAEYRFTGAINPSNNEEFFVRISTHASTDGTGPVIDYGAVVNAVVPGVSISTEVPPYLKFCVGLTIGADCESATGDTISLGTLDPGETRRGTSQMLAATNAPFGLAITSQGRTMTSGNHEIPGSVRPTRSLPGTSQFGINLRSNRVPFIGEDPAGAGIALPEPDYNIPDHYVFRNGDIVATSPAATDERRFTVSYITNVSEDQYPGVYTATVTFICSATF